MKVEQKQIFGKTGSAHIMMLQPLKKRLEQPRWRRAFHWREINKLRTRWFSMSGIFCIWNQPCIGSAGGAAMAIYMAFQKLYLLIMKHRSILLRWNFDHCHGVMFGVAGANNAIKAMAAKSAWRRCWKATDEKGSDQRQLPNRKKALLKWSSVSKWCKWGILRFLSRRLSLAGVLLVRY